MSQLTLEVQSRSETGKNVNRRLRAAGKVPAVVYGAGRDPVSIEVDRKQLHELMRGGGGEHRVFLLKLGGTDKSRHALVREVQRHPVSREIVHLDFQRVLLTELLRVQVPVELEGLPLGVKNEGGLVDFVTREVEVECLPDRIPLRLTLDIGELHVGQHLEAQHLPLPEGVTLREDADRVIAAVAHGKVHVEEAPEEEELLEAEAEEPEVIRRGKEEEDEG